MRTNASRLVLLTGLALIGGAMAAAQVRTAGNPAEGEAIFVACTGCHEIGPVARNRVGPILNNIVGRKAGTRAGYSYSRAMKEAGDEGLVWTVETLDSYLTNPRQSVRGTRMAYAGLRDTQARQDLIAYLKTLKFDEGAEKRTFR